MPLASRGQSRKRSVDFAPKPGAQTERSARVEGLPLETCVDGGRISGTGNVYACLRSLRSALESLARIDQRQTRKAVVDMERFLTVAREEGRRGLTRVRLAALPDEP